MNEGSSTFLVTLTADEIQIVIESLAMRVRMLSYQIEQRNDSSLRERVLKLQKLLDDMRELAAKGRVS